MKTPPTGVRPDDNTVYLNEGHLYPELFQAFMPKAVLLENDKWYVFETEKEEREFVKQVGTNYYCI